MLYLSCFFKTLLGLLRQVYIGNISILGLTIKYYKLKKRKKSQLTAR